MELLRYLVLTIILTIGCCQQHGLPALGCAESYPQTDLDQQTRLSPWKLDLANQTEYSPGDVIQVRIYSDNAAAQFRGFQLRAQRLLGNTEVPVGSFIGSPQHAKKQRWYPETPGQENCLTHSTFKPKKTITVEWQAPDTSVGDVEFTALVMQDEEEFWATSIRANLTAASPSEDQPYQAKISDEFRQIDVANCGEDKGCFRYPIGCQYYDCEFMVTYKSDQNNKSIAFEMFGDAEGYISMAFSKDDLTGDDDTYACVFTADNQTSLQHGVNLRDGSPVRHRVTGLTSVEMDRDGRRIYCRFTRPASMWAADLQTVGAYTMYNITTDLNLPHYLLITFGDVYKGTTVIRQPLRRAIVSKEPIYFMAHKLASGRSLTQSHIAHISLGLFARMFVGVFIVLIPRYFKTPLSDTAKNSKNPKWAVAHRIVIFMALVINGAAITVIFFEVGWEHAIEYAPLHAYFGVATMAFTTLLLLTASARACVSTESQKGLDAFNTVLGVAIGILAVCTILFGLNIDYLMPWFSSRLQSLIIGWLIIHVLFFILFEVMKWGRHPSHVDENPAEQVAMTQVGQPKDTAIRAPETYRAEGFVLLGYSALSFLFFVITLIYICLA